jgi:Kdo2-lipid IVA lauroyltransferase/acyltransferase
MLKSIRHRLEYLLFLSLLTFFSHLPEKVSYVLGEKLGDLFFRLDRRHRQISLNNLKLALGKEKKPEQLESIARQSYRHLGRSLAELSRVLAASPDKIMQSITIEGLDHFLDAHKKGGGVIYLTAHLGNWELMALVQAIQGYPIHVVARPIENPYLDDLLFRLRIRWGNQVIRKSGALREVLRLLKAGETVGFLLDQNVALHQGVFVNFFGKPACTHKTVALLAAKTGAAVLPAFTFREGSRHRIVVEPAIPLDRTEDVERDIVSNTQKFTAVIENYVRRHPEQWLWVHRRWKTQPNN